MRGTILACAFLVGCTVAPRWTTTSTSTSTDKGETSDKAAPTEAWATTPHVRCDPASPFVSVKPVIGGIPGARLTSDELTLFYTQSTCSSTRLAQLGRETIDDAFGEQTSGGIAIGWLDGWDASITADGTRFLFINANPAGLEMLNLVDHTTTNIDITSGGDPYIAPDGSALYFDGLQRSVATNGGFAAPTELPISGYKPIISGDNLTLYYAASGVYMARRATVDDEFVTSVPLVGLEKMTPDFASLDDCRLYVDDEYTLYVASR